MKDNDCFQCIANASPEINESPKTSEIKPGEHFGIDWNWNAAVWLCKEHRVNLTDDQFEEIPYETNVKN